MSNMQGKTVFITGANSGIGKETAKALALSGAKVFMGCRNLELGEQAQQEILAAGACELELVKIDLSSFKSIKQAAISIKKQTGSLDILINNAGIVPKTLMHTEEGFEMQFGVNHLGHFLLTDELMPLLKQSTDARIISVASTMHNFGNIDFNSFYGANKYNAMKAYMQSKLANVLFTRELAKRLPSNITAYALHPGAVGTNIAGKSAFARYLYKFTVGFLSEARGAKTSIFLATSELDALENGAYYNEFCKAKSGSERSNDAALATRLWQESEALCATSNEQSAVSA